MNIEILPVYIALSINKILETINEDLTKILVSDNLFQCINHH